MKTEPFARIAAKKGPPSLKTSQRGTRPDRAISRNKKNNLLLLKREMKVVVEDGKENLCGKWAVKGRKVRELKGHSSEGKEAN